MSTATTPTTADDELIAHLQRQLDAMPDARDVLNTDRAQQEHYGKQSLLRNTIQGLRTTSSEVARCAALMAPVETWIAHLTAWRREFADAHAALPANAVDRTPAQAQQHAALTAAIVNINSGCEFWNGTASMSGLLRAKITAVYQPTWDMRTLDPWAVGFGSLPAAKERLADLTHRRDMAQRDLDGYRVAAEALLSAEPRDDARRQLDEALTESARG